ncbi:MAG: hypothetical protein DLM69_01005 [Candidatus Chloroheliales bacterium]|nr:MAG: hypothetical protein DLM69_01005 [Chloroflexota bacterium]
MKLNRITSLIAFTLAMLVVFAQFIGSVQAAPPSQISGVSAQLAPGVSQTSASKPGSPADQTPYHLTVQGRLTDPSGNPITVATNVTFKLYSVPSGGSPLYTEGPVSVTPSSNGLFTYLLGSNTTWTSVTTQLFANKVYLGITVATDAEMTPRFEMTGSPYAYSLAPGAMIAGATTGNSPDPALLNVIATGGSANNAVAGSFQNTNGGTGSRTGLSVGVGGIGTGGTSSSTAGGFINSGGGSGTGGQFGIQSTLQGTVAGAGYGGFFQNLTFNTTSTQYGLFALTYSGSGIHAISDSSTNSQQSAGVVGVSLATSGLPGVGGVFTGSLGVVGYANNDTATRSSYSDGITGLTSAAGGSGVFGHGTGSGGEGVWGTAYLGASSSFGGFFDSYTQAAANTAIYARGSGHSTGGWFSPNGFGLMVQYDGNADLHPGDVIALDGNNAMVEGSQVLGVVKADASNADAAIGIAQYRYQVYPAADKTNPMSHDAIQVDDKATTIKSGDLLQIIIAGQAQVRVSGSVKVGDRLAIAADGSISAAKDSANPIGKVAGKPDANGLVTVVVNFK